VKPITVGEAMCGIVSHDWRKYAGFAEPALQLNDKFEDNTMLHLESYTQCIVFVQVSVKLNKPHSISFSHEL